MSQQNDSEQMELLESTLLREDSPAKICRSPETRKASTPKDQDYGQNCAELLATYDQSTQLWKTSQLSFLETTGDGLAEFSETWPRSGMTVNGAAYQLPNLARTITEIGSGLLPTPNATDGRQSITEKEIKAKQKRGYGLSLPQEVVSRIIWPTPTASDSKGTRKMEALKASGLGFAYSLNDALTITNGEHGKLNPEWVEWLMGYPTGHTDLKDSETP